MRLELYCSWDGKDCLLYVDKEECNFLRLGGIVYYDENVNGEVLNEEISVVFNINVFGRDLSRKLKFF